MDSLVTAESKSNIQNSLSAAREATCKFYVRFVKLLRDTRQLIIYPFNPNTSCIS